MRSVDAAQVHEGSGQEAAQADVEDKTALDDLDDLALDVLAGVELLLDAVPSALVLGTTLGEDHAALLVLFLDNLGLNGIAKSDDICRVDILADRKLANGNNALGLGVKVYQDLIATDGSDRTGDKVALVKGGKVVQALLHLVVRTLIQRKNGRVLNLTQRWTPFELTGPRLQACRCAVGTDKEAIRRAHRLDISRGPTDTDVTLMQSRWYRLR